MFRKRKRPTPNFRIPPPFNPMDGDYAKLGMEGILPYCAMMQVAENDIYPDYVVCRGFDTRVVKFVDYAEGDANRPGISVAKPFGCRGIRKYRRGEIYPAFLPIQGTATYTPPSPSGVNWRLGQNPGVASETIDGGHPEVLADGVSLLIDHNNLAVNWILIHSANEQFFRFQSIDDMVTESCLAIVRRMDRTDASVQTIHDPDGIFEGMEAGTYGRAFYQGGKYYVIQAKCEPDVIDYAHYDEE